MIIRTPLLIGSAMVLALATPAKAQYAGGAAATETTAPVPTPHKPSSFEALSAGDRKIGRALFLAQHPTESGPAPLSLNQIADLKGHGSWAKVFAQMQSRGLLQAKNLGQIVNGYQRSETRRPPARASSHRSPTLVTGGDGSVIASSQRGGISHGGDVAGETGTADIAAADKRTR
ncbi:MAG TPA: hypothetical protein VN681_13870 [Stellaceae bacterium]|nr:hypothetical protein [Stellaceae bacterium]